MSFSWYNLFYPCLSIFDYIKTNSTAPFGNYYYTSADPNSSSSGGGGAGGNRWNSKQLINDAIQKVKGYSRVPSTEPSDLDLLDVYNLREEEEYCFNSLLEAQEYKMRIHSSCSSITATTTTANNNNNIHGGGSSSTSGDLGDGELVKLYASKDAMDMLSGRKYDKFLSIEQREAEEDAKLLTREEIEARIRQRDD